jgi:hypothetical protein
MFFAIVRDIRVLTTIFLAICSLVDFLLAIAAD